MTLLERLNANPILIAPGVYDALTASLAEAAGFEALYLSGRCGRVHTPWPA
jgi:2-methylisocitrate lyase-like PEP mutase family enzyme